MKIKKHSIPIYIVIEQTKRQEIILDAFKNRIAAAEYIDFLYKHEAKSSEYYYIVEIGLY